MAGPFPHAGSNVEGTSILDPLLPGRGRVRDQGGGHSFPGPTICRVVLTSAFGAVIALHHRRRQNEKFEIIGIYERELGLDQLIKPVLDKAHKTWTGKINASTYIVVMQTLLCVVAACLLGRLLLS